MMRPASEDSDVARASRLSHVSVTDAHVVTAQVKNGQGDKIVVVVNRPCFMCRVTGMPGWPLFKTSHMSENSQVRNGLAQMRNVKMVSTL